MNKVEKLLIAYEQRNDAVSKEFFEHLKKEIEDSLELLDILLEYSDLSFKDICDENCNATRYYINNQICSEDEYDKLEKRLYDKK